MEVIMTLIGSLGFPIAMCLIMAWYINSTMKQMQITIETLKTTVENNTTAMNKVNDRLDEIEEELHND